VQRCIYWDHPGVGANVTLDLWEWGRMPCSRAWGDEVGCHNASHIFVEKNVDGMELLVIELVGLRVWCSCAIRVAVC
jgi:hypothetical protein